MKIEALLKLVVAGELQELVDGLGPLKEPMRAKLYSAYEAFWHACSSRESYVPLQGNIPEAYRWVEASIVPERRMEAMLCVDLAALGLGPQDTAYKISMRQFYGPHWRYLLQVIEARRPPWADAWVAHLLDPETRPCAFWEPLRELNLKGIIAKPVGEGYQRLLLEHVLFYERSLESSSRRLQSEAPQLASEYLRENPDLIEELYAIFLINLIDLEDYADPWRVDVQRGQEGPFHTLKTLAGEGLLDRTRLLALSLDGVMSSRSQRLRTRYANFHEGMEPTGEEVEQLQGAYLALLDLPEENLAAFGFKMLKKVDSAKALDESAFVHAAIPLLDRKGKGLVNSVLALFQKIAKRTASLRSPIFEAVAERGMLHPDGDVQEASLKLLEAWASALDKNTRAAIGGHVEEMAATLQDRARVLAGPEKGAPKGPSETKPRGKAKKPAVPDLPGPWHSLAGVGAAQTAIAAGTLPPPLLLDTGNVPVLTGVKPLRAVETLDDIMILAGRQIDQSLTAIEMEQLLGGISETDPASEENFDRLAAPLLKRMDWAREELGHLLYTWLSLGKVHDHFDEELPTEGYRGSTFWQFQHHRIRNVRASVLKGHFVSLLATPTHEGGWLAASAFVQRLRILHERKVEPDKLDFVQALLRLAPDGREDAAAQLQSGTDQYLRISRWALTGEGKADKKDDPDLWLAAARARRPRDTVDVPGLLAEMLAGPDGAAPATYDWIADEEKAAIAAAEDTAREEADKALQAAIGHLDELDEEALELVLASANKVDEAVPGGGWLHRPLREDFSIKVTPPWVHGGDQLGRPTVMLHAFPSGGPTMHRERYEFEWATMIWPHNRDALYAGALLYIAHAYIRSSSKKWPAGACLDPLYEPDQPITLPAALLLSLSLFAPPGDLSQSAVDVLVEAIGDGRLHPDQFAEALPRLCATRYFQPGRMAKYLAEVAQVSPLHAWTVAGMLQAAVARWREVPKNGHHVLERLLELLAQLGQPLDADAAMALGAIKTGGKSAKLVKQLLALETVDNGAMAEVRRLALQARIARAERWAGV